MVDGVVGVAKLHQSIVGPPAVSMNGVPAFTCFVIRYGGGGGGKGQICLGAGDITDMK